MEDTSYAASIDLHLERMKGDVWTLEMKDRGQGCNIVRRELGLEATRVPAADPSLQTDIVPRMG